ncbi:MAG: CvpA family protein [Bacteroidetes bacterium]|nr:CvpA family protein [Bacteroidota bacterium]
MNTLDLIISFIVIIPALIGFQKGLLKSIFSLIGIVAGFLLATNYNELLTGYLSFLKFDPKILSLISFVLIFVSVNLLLGFISKKISGFNFITKTFDRIFGLLFGLLKGVIIASIFLLITTKLFSVFSDKTVKDSIVYPHTVDAAPGVYNFLKGIFPDGKDFYNQFNFLKDFNKRNGSERH